MAKFAGFPEGKVRVTPIPDLFFSELLAQMDDLAELKATLHICWRLAHHPAPPGLSRAELLADPVLKQALDSQSLDDALRRATERGTLIQLRAKNKAGETEFWYFLNNESGRRAVKQVREGKVRLRRGVTPVALPTPGETPNVFGLYEQYIGMLTQLIAEQLQEASQVYPAQWIREAFELAARNDKRSWRYAQAILQGWAREGRSRPEGARRKARKQPALKPKP